MFTIRTVSSILIFFFLHFAYFIAPLENSRENSRRGSRCPLAATHYGALLRCLQGICMSRQSQIRFLSDVGIFIVHAWCVTQTRPRFNVPSERRGITSFSNTQFHRCTMPGPGIEPGPFPWEASSLTTELHPLLSNQVSGKK